MGSSPRVWGQEIFIVISLVVTGIIPTRVGTRLVIKNRFGKNEYHPHACGDKTRPNPIATRTIGSSPRVWGQVSGVTNFLSGDRIIPTRVGTSVSCDNAVEWDKDHPHACGDKQSNPSHRRKTSGSSPRVWGQVIHGLLLFMLTRIIPTRVGTSLDIPK